MTLIRKPSTAHTIWILFDILPGGMEMKYQNTGKQGNTNAIAKVVWISSENNAIHSEMPSLSMRHIAHTWHISIG